MDEEKTIEVNLDKENWTHRFEKILLCLFLTVIGGFSFIGVSESLN